MKWILHVENAEESQKKNLELVNEFNKVTGYEIIIQKNQFCFYILAMYKYKSLENNSIHNSIKNNKYLGINLTRSVRIIYWKLKNIDEKKLKMI